MKDVDYRFLAVELECSPIACGAVRLSCQCNKLGQVTCTSSRG